MSIHSQNDAVILEFGLKKPAFRICVNTPTTHGSIGLTTGLDPAMTLGCGGYGGNITSDNITPRHLLNIKRLAYELRPAAVRRDATAPPPEARLPKAPAEPAVTGVGADTMRGQIESMISARRGGAAPAAPGPPQAQNSGTIVDFVCEEDVRQALRLGRKITIGERTIVTPSARDLGDAHRILVMASWPRE